MEITLIIVAGLSLMTLFAVIGDYMSKKKLAVSQETAKRVQELDQQVQLLEAKLNDRDDRIGRLEEGISFVNRLLEDKTRK